MIDCWVCKQKAEVRNAKMNALRDEAKEKSRETGKTMVIVQKSGCVFEVVDKDQAAGLNIKEYISDNSS